METKSQVIVSLQHLSAHRLAQLLLRVAEHMGGHPEFSGCPLALPSLVTRAGQLDAADKAVTDLRVQAKNLVAARKLLVRQAGGDVTQVANFVQSVSKGDRTIIALSGFEVKKPKSPLGPLGQPESLVASATKKPGEAQLRWKKLPGAKGYHVERSVNPSDPAGWTRVASATGARLLVTGLPSGSRVWFRVAGQGVRGEGPHSDVASCQPL